MHTRVFQTFTVSQTCKEKCAHVNKKSNNLNNCLHAEVKINICIQFTTLKILTNLNMYKYCLIQKIRNSWISGIKRLCILKRPRHIVFTSEMLIWWMRSPKDIISSAVALVWLEDDGGDICSTVIWEVLHPATITVVKILQITVIKGLTSQATASETISHYLTRR